MWLKKTEKKMGQILVGANLVTEEQLENGLRKQRENGQYLSKNLVELGYINELEIARCIAEQCKLPCVSLDRYKIDDELLNVIPENISKAYGVIPLEMVKDILTVAVVDILDEATIKRIEELTGFKVRVTLVTVSDFDKYMNKMQEYRAVINEKEFENTRFGQYIKTVSYEGQEKRRYPRFDKELKVKYEFNNEFIINSSINVSRGGVLTKSRAPLPLNSHVRIQMELPNLDDEVIIISRVIRVKKLESEDTYHIAFNFISMDLTNNKKLTEFVRSLKE